jgi:hypothetical protein
LPLDIRSILDPLGMASTIVFIDIIIAMIIMFMDPATSLFFTVSAYLIFEFGVMLVIGACFMARQPLEMEKRFDETGEPVRAWIWALRGKKVLVASIFVIIYAFCIGGLGTLF